MRGAAGEHAADQPPSRFLSRFLPLLNAVNAIHETNKRTKFISLLE
jgi:hypothetical protein